MKQAPGNANQLAERLGVDYKTIRHHLKVLQDNGLAAYAGEGGYAATYFVSPSLEENYATFQEIWSQIGKKNKDT